MLYYKEFKKPKFNAIKNGKKFYINIPACLDTETSSFYESGEKRACMYIWQFGISGVYYYGRTYEELGEFIDILTEYFALYGDLYLVVYVQNLGFDWQFISHLFTPLKVIANKPRNPLYIETAEHIIFKDTQILSGLSLAKMAEDLGLKKLVGDLDYSLLRGCSTPLTEKELEYCEEDVHILNSFIEKELSKNDNDITKIPLTKTGYVRRFCREKCMSQSQYRKFIKTLVISHEEYEMLLKAYSGGYTHANILNCGKIFETVNSYDFTSSYPAVMVSDYFPLSKGEKIKITSKEHLEKLLNSRCVLMTCKFKNLKAKPGVGDYYISFSKCEEYTARKDFKGVIVNGRLREASQATLTVTEIDFKIIRECYTFDGLSIMGDAFIYERGYLPKPLIECIATFYKGKTELKSVEGKEEDYQVLKGMLNGIYGMMCEKIVRPSYEISSTGEWITKIEDPKDQIENYNKSKKRFTFFPWGVWITAHSRKNLWSAVLELGSDYIYSDTDSVKFTNLENHENYFNEYNEKITIKVRKVCEYYGLKYEENFAPCTKVGEIKPIGVWDYEGCYSKFKTLGAKRYVSEKNGKLSITISGLGKKKGAEFLQKTGAPFYEFDFGLQVPEEFTGKMTHTYIDREIMGEFVDYSGKIQKYHEYNIVHLEPAKFELSDGGNISEHLFKYLY